MDILEKVAEYYKNNKTDIDKTMKNVVAPVGLGVMIGVTLFKLGYEKGYIDGLIDIMNKNEGKFINF